MDGLSLTCHAAKHSLYKNNLTPEEIQMLENLPLCKLSRAKCYELAVQAGNWNLTKLHLDTAPQRVNMATGSDKVTALMMFGH
jgi:hypothetical protein